MLKNQAALGVAKVDQNALELLVEVRDETWPDSGFYRCVDAINERKWHIYRQNLTMTNTIPTRFSRKVFDRVAPIIGDALRSFPKPVRVETRLSTRTLARLVQEGLAAKRKYNYSHPAIDEALWTLHHASLGTSEQDGNVLLVGDKTILRKTADPITPDPSVTEVEIDNSLGALLALATLIAGHGVKTPIRFYVYNPPGDAVEDIESRFDVVFTPDETSPTKHYIT